MGAILALKKSISKRMASKFENAPPFETIRF